MESLLIQSITHPLSATIKIPGSKSLTNRALLIGALAKGRTSLTNALFSDDSRYFATALQCLGFEIFANSENCEYTITGLGGKIPASNAELFIGNAGTAARFLSAFLTLGHGEYILDGDGRMRERPIGDLVASLKELGANVRAYKPNANNLDSEIFPPIKITALGLPGGKTSIPGDISSQFLSALLMVAPYAQKQVEITVSTKLNSKPYVDMTLGVMEDFGVKIIRDGYANFVISSGNYHQVENYPIEPDASAASYFFAAPAILGGSVRVENITRNSRQGDIEFVEILQSMGCKINEGQNFIEVIAPSSPTDLQGVDVDMSDIPDTAQTLAAIAPFASSPTHIRGIASARVKESDRISATCTELARLGVPVVEHQDGMTIYPCKFFSQASVQTYNDHRMAMAFALVGLRIPGVRIENPGCVSKTFPGYFKTLEGLL